MQVYSYESKSIERVNEVTVNKIYELPYSDQGQNLVDIKNAIELLEIIVKNKSFNVTLKEDERPVLRTILSLMIEIKQNHLKENQKEILPLLENVFKVFITTHPNFDINTTTDNKPTFLQGAINFDLEGIVTFLLEKKPQAINITRTESIWNLEKEKLIKEKVIVPVIFLINSPKYIRILADHPEIDLLAEDNKEYRFGDHLLAENNKEYRFCDLLLDLYKNPEVKKYLIEKIMAQAVKKEDAYALPQLYYNGAQLTDEAYKVLRASLDNPEGSDNSSNADLRKRLVLQHDQKIRYSRNINGGLVIIGIVAIGYDLYKFSNKKTAAKQKKELSQKTDYEKTDVQEETAQNKEKQKTADNKAMAYVKDFKNFRNHAALLIPVACIAFKYFQ
ncbi:hypothetical protein JKY79_02940 [Candidatus Babeliales bacterium]|nr:hypothetical protein [Candidatus Babeliales bacterium]